jgi:2-polyprenyl-6-methoxyphenol hydroxylase-like FAD-dependent oxidoreductase
VHSETDVRVTTEDGEEFRGDVVIGADGTHSVVRREMWDLADKLKPGLITEEERNSK